MSLCPLCNKTLEPNQTLCPRCAVKMAYQDLMGKTRNSTNSQQAPSRILGQIEIPEPVQHQNPPSFASHSSATRIIQSDPRPVALLLGLNAEIKDQAYLIREGLNRIQREGEGPEKIILPSTYISREGSFEIYCDQGYLFSIKSLPQSANKVMLNQNFLPQGESRPLLNMARIQIGHLNLCFISFASSESNWDNSFGGIS